MRPPRTLTTHLELGITRNSYGRITHKHHDPIKDLEGFCRSIADDTMGSWGSGMFVTPDEYTDIVLELMEIAVKAERGFNPERNPSLAGYLRWLLGKRVADVAPRKLLGRTGLRAQARQHEELDERTVTGTRPWETHTEIPGDPDSDCGTSHGRLDRHGDRPRAWAHTILGLRTA